MSDRELYAPELGCAADVEGWLDRLYRDGFNFHPDTPGADYVERHSGDRTFTDAEAECFDEASWDAAALCERAGSDLYEVAYRAQRRDIDRRAELVRREAEARVSEAIGDAVTAQLGHREWTGDVDPPTVLRLDEAVEAVAQQLLTNDPRQKEIE